MGTPDTVIYMVAGYVVIFSVLAVYIGSLFWRFNSLRNLLNGEPQPGRETEKD